MGWKPGGVPLAGGGSTAGVTMEPYVTVARASYPTNDLRKLSDPPLADCPACGEPRFEKQVTAAGFQLKGSGWYVTDFRNPQAAPPAAGKADAGLASTDKAEKPGDGSPAAPTASAAPAAAAAPATAPAASSASIAPASGSGDAS
jgi:putative FmdB family regulatory protein